MQGERRGKRTQPVSLLLNALLMVICPEGGLHFDLVRNTHLRCAPSSPAWPPTLLPPERLPGLRENGLLDRGRLFCNARHSRQ